MEPPLPGRPGQPPWSLGLHPSGYLTAGLAAAGITAGALGLLLTLRAVRYGWLVSPRLVLLAGITAAAIMTLLPPFGSSDPLSYAAYGRELVTGHDPYAVAPAALARLGDPVARAVQDWAAVPSVYGAAATALEGLASLAGGTSPRLTVFVLDALNFAAFSSTGILLDRLARSLPDAARPAARLRAALLWACNPLLLQVLVAGGHLDSQAVFFAVAAVALLRPLLRGSPVPSALARGVLAGAAIGLGCAVKPPVLLVGLGLAVALRRLGGTAAVLGAFTAGFLAVSAAGLLLAGAAGLRQMFRASGMVSVGSPWRLIRTLLGFITGEAVADDTVRYCAVALAAAIALLLVMRSRRGPGYGAGVWPAFSLVLAWLLAWPYVLPWYGALGWALLALLPAWGLDWLLIAWTTALGLGYLPARAAGITVPGGLRWMEPVIRSALTPAVLAALTVVLILMGILRARPQADNRE